MQGCCAKKVLALRTSAFPDLAEAAVASLGGELSGPTVSASRH